MVGDADVRDGRDVRLLRTLIMILSRVVLGNVNTSSN